VYLCFFIIQVNYEKQVFFLPKICFLMKGALSMGKPPLDTSQPPARVVIEKKILSNHY